MRSQDTVFVIGAVTSSVVGRELAWKFVQDKWSDLHGRYRGGFLLARLIKVTVCLFVYIMFIRWVLVVLFLSISLMNAKLSVILILVESDSLGHRYFYKQYEIIYLFKVYVNMLPTCVECDIYIYI